MTKKLSTYRCKVGLFGGKVEVLPKWIGVRGVTGKAGVSGRETSVSVSERYDKPDSLRTWGWRREPWLIFFAIIEHINIKWNFHARVCVNTETDEREKKKKLILNPRGRMMALTVNELINGAITWAYGTLPLLFCWSDDELWSDDDSDFLVLAFSSALLKLIKLSK